MSLVSEIKKIPYWDAILTVVLVLLFYQIISFALGTSHPVDVIVSESMLPSIKPGDIVICAKDTPQVGNVVIYAGARQYPIIHRVIGINDSFCRGENFYHVGVQNGTCYTIKGDNNPVPDVPVMGEQVMCVVKAQIPYVGYPRYLIYKVLSI